MPQTILKPEPEQTLEVPENATRTSDFQIREDARDVYAARVLAALEGADDLMIALEIRRRTTAEPGEVVEVADFIREQGYDPADFAT